MTTCKRVIVRGSLELRFEYALASTDTRRCPYTAADTRYQPETLRFTLATRSTGEHLPQYKNYEVWSVSLTGHKLKKDGTLSRNTANENFHSGNYPDWVGSIIRAAAKEFTVSKDIG